MHRITLTITLLLAVTCADAAWYQKTDGTTVDPIMSIYGSVHPYGEFPHSGNNLEPNADLVGAYLETADLERASLSNANLTNANLWGNFMPRADLSNANLNGADLSWGWMPSVDLSGADLTDAVLMEANLTNADLTGTVFSNTDLRGANLSGVNFSLLAYYETALYTGAYYYEDNEPNWHINMDAAWRSGVGIVASAPPSTVPEPSAFLLALVGLAIIRRRRA